MNSYINESQDDMEQKLKNPTLTDPEWKYDFLDSSEQMVKGREGKTPLQHLLLVEKKDESIHLMSNIRGNKLTKAEEQLLFINILPVPKDVKERILIEAIKNTY